jgi:lysophospholipase L1-like esterase
MGNTTVRRRHAAFAAGLAALALAAGVASAPAQAADKIKYIALGDSFAAGQGAGPYLDDCFRSDNAYSELADESKAIKLVVNAACSGKTTRDVVNDQLSQLNKSTELVTITAGGNNLGFGDIINYCGIVLANLPPAQECAGAVAHAEAQLQSGQLESDLVAMIQSVQAAAPNAEIVVTGYPYLLDPIPAGLTDPAAQFIYQATDLADRLNRTIANAVAAVDDPQVQYVDVRAAFLGHGALSPEPWINLGTAPDGFHPNAAGYQAYFTALSQAGTFATP